LIENRDTPGMAVTATIVASVDETFSLHQEHVARGVKAQCMIMI